MGLRDETEDPLFKRHSDLCTKLNLEPKTVSESWDNFQSINKNYVLEGDPLHWLGVAVFVACRGVETPTVGQTMVKGNCVNLTSLLRHSNLSFQMFFANVNKWAEMAKLNDEFRAKIKHLKETFSVTYNTFKEYYSKFQKIFITPDPQDFDQLKQHRNRKQKPVLCNSSKVFEFVWMLFITLKKENSHYSTELLKSYHLLYACLDLIFQNAFLDDRRDLINPDCEVLPEDWKNPSYEVPDEAPCMIATFCKAPAMLTDAMHLKMYDFKELIVNLIRNNELVGDREHLTGFLDSSVFETNFKNILKMYESQLLQRGDFDERIFVAEYKRILLEREQWRAPQTTDPGDSSLDSPRNSNSTAPYTPLTAVQYLGPREADSSPYSNKTAYEQIARLQNIIHNRQPDISQTLLQIFQSCSNDPTDKIKEIVTNLGEKFTNAYPINNCPNEEETNNRLQIATTLFYKFIEGMIQIEKNIREDISDLIQKGIFYECTFACCLEIVIFSFSFPENARKFPWILNVLEIEVYHFVKVIELIIRSREHLTKEMIKHLNRIEETILESLIWKSDSQIWKTIEQSGQEIPKYEDTALPSHISDNVVNRAQSPNTSVQSEPSATDHFQSPVNSNTSVNRQLFPVLAGQSVLQQKSSVTGTPKRTGSLAIIFRKFYNLASVRMKSLCVQLSINEDLQRKIWTTFIDSICHTDLIKDRHLDQLLMCAVYVICKICCANNPQTFEKIMKVYREQPQACSNIYRNVFLERKDEDGTAEEKRIDLIQFYNAVYVNEIKRYALVHDKTSSRLKNNDIYLSPLPNGIRNLVSPSLQVVGNVFVKPLESPVTVLPNKSINYIFSRSPSKDLKDINKAINNSGVSRKRLLSDGDMDIPNAKRISNRKIQALIEERRNQNSE